MEPIIIDQPAELMVRGLRQLQTDRADDLQTAPWLAACLAEVIESAEQAVRFQQVNDVSAYRWQFSETARLVMHLTRSCDAYGSYDLGTAIRQAFLNPFKRHH